MAINSVQVPIDLVDVALDRHFALSDQNTDPAIPSILASVPVLSAIIPERDLQPYDVLNEVAVENDSEIKYVYFLSLVYGPRLLARPGANSEHKAYIASW